MLGKLLKYEVKATSMTFLLLYIVILAFSVCNKAFMSFDFEWGIIITGMILFTLFMALGVITLIVVIQRFNKNLLGDEGYLMFTLPVKTRDLVTSKILVAFMWTILSCIVAVVAFLILAIGNIDWTVNPQVNWQELFTLIEQEVQKEFNMNTISLMISLIVAMVGGYAQFILMIYASLSIAQFPKFNKHRIMTAFGAFIVLSTIIDNILPAILSLVVDFNNISVKAGIISGNIFLIITDILLFIGINKILSKHLNLE